MDSIRHALKCIRQQTNVKHIQRSARCNEHLCRRSGLRPHMFLHPVHYARRVVLFFCSRIQYVMCHWTSLDIFTSFTQGKGLSLCFIVMAL